MRFPAVASMTGRRRPWRHLPALPWAVLIGWTASHGEAPPAPVPAAGLLELASGDTLPGTLVAATADGSEDLRTLAWQSPLFVEPFRFRLDMIRGLRFPEAPAAAGVNANAFRLRLRDGDSIDGELESIDESRVAIRRQGADGLLHVRRAAVESVARLGAAAAATYAGPGGLAGWQSSPAGAWRDEAGRLVTDRRAAVERDLGSPPRARFDIVLSWRSRPEFRIAPGAAAEPAADPAFVEALRVADGSTVLGVVRSERDRAAIEPLDVVVGDAGRMRLALFLDQPAGELTVHAHEEDGPVMTATVRLAADPTREPSGRFRLLAMGGELCLESLRVAPWRAGEPALDAGTSAAVVARDGSRRELTVEGLVAGSGRLKVIAEGQPSTLPVDALDELTFPAESAGQARPDAGSPPTVRVVDRDGAAIGGSLLAIDEGAVVVRHPEIAEPVILPRDRVAAITCLRAEPAAESLPGRQGRLLVAGVTLPGCLVAADPQPQGLAWLPLGSTTAGRFAAGVAEAGAVVEYVPRARGEPRADSQVEVGGIGGMVNPDAQGDFVVTMLSEEGAAARDGRLEPGDRLLAVRPREDGGFVPTEGHDATTVMNLLRGRVGTPVWLKVAGPDGREREIDLSRGLIYVAGREVLEQALATHARLAAAQVALPDGGRVFSALAILLSGDVVPVAIDGIDAEGVRLRTPVADDADETSVTVPAALVQAVELDPNAASRDIPRSQLDRLLTLPRAQREHPPTHMVRLSNGDYLRGRLESLDRDTAVIDVRGERKSLRRADVARVIWLHPGEPAVDAAGHDDAAIAPPDGRIAAGPLVQGVAAGRRITLVAEAISGDVLLGRSPAFGPGRFGLADVDRILIGEAIAEEADERPYRQWRLHPALEPRALREVQPAEGR